MIEMSQSEFEMYERRRRQKQDMEEVATLAVKKMLAILGVDMDKPKDVAEFRRDIQFSGDMRRAAEKGKIALFIFLITAIAGWAFFGGGR